MKEYKVKKEDIDMIWDNVCSEGHNHIMNAIPDYKRSEYDIQRGDIILREYNKVYYVVTKISNTTVDMGSSVADCVAIHPISVKGDPLRVIVGTGDLTYRYKKVYKFELSNLKLL